MTDDTESEPFTGELPRWVEDAIEQGLQMLGSLRLRGAPADDVMSGTFLTWCAALRPLWWSEKRDRQRIAIAFERLVRDRAYFPSPREFLDTFHAVPIAQTQKKLAGRARLSDQHRMATLAKVTRDSRDLFRMPERETPDAPGPDAGKTEAQIRAEVEAHARDAATRGRDASCCPHKGRDREAQRRSAWWLDAYWRTRDSLTPTEAPHDR